MQRCLIVLCVGTLLVAVKTAPAPQAQNPIDFLLDLNQDLVEKEVPASVRPISQAQVGTTTERIGGEPAPVFEDQEANVQEIPRELAPTASQLNKDRDQGEDQEDREDGARDQGEEQDVQEDDGRSDSEEESEQKDQQATSKDDDQNTKEEDKEDTTIRVYGPEDDENGEQQQNEQKDQDRGSDLRKVEPEVQRQSQVDIRQPEVVISQHADTVKQFEEAVDQRGTDLLQEVDLQVTNPEVISEQPESLDEQQEIEVKPDQLFNHGSIVIDKSTFATDEDLPSTTPFSGKKWNHDHGPPGFGPWHSKFPGFPGHNHDHDHDHDHDHEGGRPPFFGMPPFNGPPPRFDGPPPHWHLHNHSHEHRDWHHDHDHGFHGHGFHRRGPWQWNRS